MVDVLKEMKEAKLKIDKLNEENERNKGEREGLSREIEEFKQVNGENLKKIEKLTKEVDDLKRRSKEECQVMKNEVEELKTEIGGLKKKYESHEENKHNITNQPPTPAFQTKEKLLIGGFEKFIENNNSLAVPIATYGEWYGEIFNRLQVNRVYLYEKYLFVKVRFTYFPNTINWQSFKRDDKNKLKISITNYVIKTFTYNENWDHSHVTYSIILHPKEVNRCLELDKTMIGDGYDEFQIDYKVTENHYHDHQLILCCKKK